MLNLFFALIRINKGLISEREKNIAKYRRRYFQQNLHK